MLDRRVLGPGVTRQVVHPDGVVGRSFLPPGAGPHPAVIVLGGLGGAIDEYWGSMLASHGYAAFNLAYFAQPGLPRGLVDLPLEYFENAIRWMRKQPWLGDRFLAAWGTSRGGELALLLGATFPDINAVSAWVPSGVMFWGIGADESGDPRDRASWTFRGKPLPYLQQDNPFAEKIPTQERGHPIAYAPFYRFPAPRGGRRPRWSIWFLYVGQSLMTGRPLSPFSKLAAVAAFSSFVERSSRALAHLCHFIIRSLIPHVPRTVLVSAMAVEGFNGYLYSQAGRKGQRRSGAEAGGICTVPGQHERTAFDLDGTARSPVQGVEITSAASRVPDRPAETAAGRSGACGLIGFPGQAPPRRHPGTWPVLMRQAYPGGVAACVSSYGPVLAGYPGKREGGRCVGGGRRGHRSVTSPARAGGARRPHGARRTSPTADWRRAIRSRSTTRSSIALARSIGLVPFPDDRPTTRTAAEGALPAKTQRAPRIRRPGNAPVDSPWR